MIGNKIRACSQYCYVNNMLCNTDDIYMYCSRCSLKSGGRCRLLTSEVFVTHSNSKRHAINSAVAPREAVSPRVHWQSDDSRHNPERAGGSRAALGCRRSPTNVNTRKRTESEFESDKSKRPIAATAVIR